MRGEAMGFFEFLIATVPVILFFSIPLYAIKRGSDQKDEKLRIKQLKEEKELEMLKQENYLLENKQMRLELDQIREQRSLKEENRRKEGKWLIQDSEDKEM